jgi:hypothetical protein
MRRARGGLLKGGSLYLGGDRERDCRRNGGGDLPPTKKPPGRAALCGVDIRACSGQACGGPRRDRGRARCGRMEVEEATCNKQSLSPIEKAASYETALVEDRGMASGERESGGRSCAQKKALPDPGRTSANYALTIIPVRTARV